MNQSFITHRVQYLINLGSGDVLCEDEKRRTSFSQSRTSVTSPESTRQLWHCTAVILSVCLCFCVSYFQMMNTYDQPSLENNATPSGATRRPRNEEEWTKVKAKKMRNLGQAYISRNTHQRMQARQVSRVSVLNSMSSLLWCQSWCSGWC